ncbi:MAG: DMT family transporter [Synechococcus sp.]
MGNAQKGTRALVLSGLAFSLMTVCVKQLGGRLPVEEIVLARAVISLAITSVAIRRLGLSPWGQDKAGLLLRGTAGTVALLCFFYAIAALPLGAATVLQYTYPTFTAAAAALVLKERLGRLIVLALPLGWIGVVMVVQPAWVGQAGSGLPMGPALVAVAGAFFTAMAYVCVRRLSVTEHPLVIIFYFPLISIPVTLPGVLNRGVMPTGMEWAWLLGVGVLTQLGQIWVTEGLRRLPAGQATTINYVQVVFAALWGWLWFNEQINGTTLLGGILILGASLISAKSRTTIEPTQS